MEIITMESKAWQEMAGKIDTIAAYIMRQESGTETMETSVQDGKWMPGDEVEQYLGISARTLQRYRTRRELSFTKMGRCLYYRHKYLNIVIVG